MTALLEPKIRDADLAARLARMNARIAADEGRWREELKTVTATQPCEKHPSTLRELDREASVEQSAWSGKRVLVMAPCPECAREADERRLALALEIPEPVALATLDGYAEHGDMIARQQQRATVEALRRWVLASDAERERFFFLQGKPGTGKSHLAAAALKRFARACPGRERSFRWANAEDVVPSVWASYGQGQAAQESALRRFTAPRVLVWDDLGLGKHNPDAIEIQSRIIRARAESAARWTIITSNFAVKPLLTGFFDERIASRVRASRTASPWMDWEDWRVKA